MHLSTKTPEENICWRLLLKVEGVLWVIVVTDLVSQWQRTQQNKKKKRAAGAEGETYNRKIESAGDSPKAQM